MLRDLIQRRMGALPDWGRSLHIVLVESVLSWIDHRAASKGAALAFYALFSLTPILMFAIAMAGHLFGTATAQGEIIALLQHLIGPNGAQAVKALLLAAQDPVSSALATLLATVVLLVGTTSVFVELKGSLDELWGVDKSRRPTVVAFLQTRLVSFALVMALGLLLIVTMLVRSALAVVGEYTGSALGNTAALLGGLSNLVSFGLITSLFALIYKTLPDAPLSWRDVSIGALVTASLFSLGELGIGLYLSKSGVASGFGAAGSIIALLLWVYYSAQIFFFGAEFTRQYALRFGSLRC